MRGDKIWVEGLKGLPAEYSKKQKNTTKIKLAVE